MKEKSFVSVNPVDGKEIATYPVSTGEQVEHAIFQSQKACLRWSRSEMKERSALFVRIAAVIRKDLEQYATLATQEMGKPIVQSRAELEKCARTFEFYAKEGPAFLANEIVHTEERKSFVSFQPLGTVLAIMPWNFPYWQVFRAMAPILMSGNAMVLKHASNVSGCALAIEKIVKKAKAPQGLFQTLLLPSSQVGALIESPGIAAITFTGSTNAGRKVASVAALNLKKQVLELGGSDAYVVLEDADLDLAVKTCLDARLTNGGQSCVAAKRFIIVKKLRKEFEARMLEQIRLTTYGAPMDESVTIGPMARVDLRNELHQQVQKSIKAGAQLLHGGVLPKGPGAFYPPTLLTGVKKGMPAYEEELFGPVAVIIEAKDEKDAIRIANDSEYGLGGAVFTKDRKRGAMIAEQLIQAGSCFVNEAVHSDPRLPFGGIKHSGYGRELSAYALREFVNIKTVVVS
jgi:succinate-semialdehyde dehydrogenase/glutarate-semialdehyde dehydrogenase